MKINNMYRKSILCGLLITLLGFSLNAYAKVIYVKEGSSGNGTSWKSPYGNLQSALQDANATGGSNQIWVASGTYKPSIGSSNDPHTFTFLLQGNIALYGGFKGNETQLMQRNPIANVTVLSGDLLGNDLINLDDPNYTTSRLDNVYHVLTAGTNMTTTTAIVDGFTVRGGNETENEFLSPTGSPALGGGLWIIKGSVNVNKDIFMNNSAVRVGGAIAVDGAGNNLTVSNSSFISNAETSPIINSFHGGGAISIRNDATASITQSFFTNNRCGEDGSAIRSENANWSLTNSIFTHNHAEASGTVTVDSFGELFTGTSHQANFEQLVFNDNFVGSFGGGIETIGIFPSPASVVNVKGSVFNGNVSGPSTHAPTLNGGGAIGAADLNMNIDGCFFNSNQAGHGGGAIYNNGSLLATFGLPRQTVKVNNSIFKNNTVRGDVPTYFNDAVNVFINGLLGVPAVNIPPSTLGGGAISNDTNAFITITNSQFSNNSTPNAGDGGAIENGGGAFTVFPNTANAFTVDGGTVSISGSSFQNNYAIGNGGAIASESPITGSTDLQLMLGTSQVCGNTAGNPLVPSNQPYISNSSYIDMGGNTICQ